MPLVLMGNLDQRGKLDRLDLREKLVCPEDQETLDCKDLRDHKDLRVLKVTQVTLVPQEVLAYLGLKEPRGLPEALELKV